MIQHKLMQLASDFEAMSKDNLKLHRLVVELTDAIKSFLDATPEGVDFGFTEAQLKAIAKMKSMSKLDWIADKR